MIANFTFAIICLSAVWCLFDTRMRFKRRNHANNLMIIYDQMEMTAIKKNITPNNSLINILKFYKSLQMNNFMADIRVVLLNRIFQTEEIIQKSKKLFANDTKDLPLEMMELINQFNEEYTHIIRISTYKFSFLIFVFKVIVLAKMQKGHTKIVVMYQGIKEVFNEQKHSLINFLNPVEPELNFSHII